MKHFLLVLGAVLVIYSACVNGSANGDQIATNDNDDSLVNDQGFDLFDKAKDVAGKHIKSSIEDQGKKHLNKLANQTRSTFHTILLNISQYIPVSIEYAEEVGRNCNIIEFNAHYYGAPALVYAAILFVIGALFCFFGYRLLKVNLFLIGFLIGGSFAYAGTLAFLINADGNWKLYVSLAVTVVVGVVIGLITIAIYYIGMFLAGGSVGFLAAWFLLSVIDISYLERNIWIPFLIAFGVGIVCGIITLIFQKWPVIVGTSVVGAFLIAWSLDYYLELGLMMYYLFLFAENRHDLKPCWYSWTILGLFVLVALSGLLLQGCVTGRKYDHKKDLNDKGICCGLCRRVRKRESRSGNYMPLKEMD